MNTAFLTQLNTFNRSKLLLYLMLILVSVFIILQMYVLTSVGVEGKKISRLQQESHQLTVENEILNAEIQKLQARSQVISALDGKDFQEAEITYLEADDFNRFAQLAP